MMKGKNEISVFVICAEPSGLNQCLDGLATQTLTPAKITVVSCNQQPEVHHYVMEKLKLEFLSSPGNGTVEQLRNLAMDHCDTELIAFLDSDLVPSPDWLEFLSEALIPRCNCMKAKAEKTSGVCGFAACIFATGTTEKALNWGTAPIDNPPALFASNALFKMEKLKAAGGFDCNSNNPEEDLSAKLCSSGAITVYNPLAKCARF